MKILVDFNQDGSIRAVKNTEKYNLSEDEIKDQVSKENMRLGYGKYMLKEITSDLENVFDFLLGEKGYKVYGDIETIEDSINTLSANLGSISDDVFNMVSNMEKIEKLLEEFKERYESNT